MQVPALGVSLYPGSHWHIPDRHSASEIVHSAELIHELPYEELVEVVAVVVAVVVAFAVVVVVVGKTAAVKDK